MQCIIIGTCVRHIPIPAMLETQGTACMQIYIWSAHSFNILHVLDSTDCWLNRCLDIWNALNNDWNIRPPHSSDIYHRTWHWHLLTCYQFILYTLWCVWKHCHFTQMASSYSKYVDQWFKNAPTTICDKQSIIQRWISSKGNDQHDIS